MARNDRYRGVKKRFVVYCDRAIPFVVEDYSLGFSGRLRKLLTRDYPGWKEAIVNSTRADGIASSGTLYNR